MVKGIFKKDKDGNWREYKQMLLQFSHEVEGRDDISIITSIGYNKLKKDQIKGFCHHRFKANLIVEGLDLGKIYVGSSLTIGKVVVIVSSIGKACHRECPALAGDNKCTLGKYIIFARIVQSGKIAYHDFVEQ